MKVFIDILTPKQCMLFSKLIEHLRKDGHQVLEVTREYREVIQLLHMKGIDAKIVGHHGGGTLSGKLKASAERTLQLAALIEEWKPDVAVSFSSPETARAAFGLNIPHVCVNDSPHAEAVARLTIPLSKRLVTPKVIPKKIWLKFGIAPNSIVQYNALDPWAWLKDFKPNDRILVQLGLNRSKPIVVFRTEEAFAAYLLGKTSKTPTLLSLIEKLCESNTNFQVVVIPRYETQITKLKETFGERVVVCEFTTDAPSLLSFTSLFVGAGGTMTTEAALLGVPTFSCYPDKPFLIERFLINKRLVTRENSLKELQIKILKTLENLESVKKNQTARAQKLTSKFEDPIKVIMKTILNAVDI